MIKMKLYDLTKLTEMSRGKVEFVTKMLNLFIEMAPRLLAEMNQALAMQEVDTIRKIAHQLKPSLSNLGIESLKNTISELEFFDPSVNSEAQLLELVSYTTQTISSVVEAMKEANNAAQ